MATGLPDRIELPPRTTEFTPRPNSIPVRAKPRESSTTLFFPLISILSSEMGDLDLDHGRKLAILLKTFLFRLSVS